MQRDLATSICLVGACAFVVVGTAGSADEPTVARSAAIKASQQSGGKIGYPNQKLEVSFRDLNVADADLKDLKQLTDLAQLELRGPPVTDAGLAHLKGLANLEYLCLYDTTVGDAGLEHLKNLTTLRFLMLKQTNVTDAGVEKLERALPECETISHSLRAPAQPAVVLPVGKWNVEFANGVKQSCEIRQDGTVSIIEPRRIASGKATAVKGGSVVVVIEDDVVERWTPVDKRYVVQFWYPGSQFPNATPLLGIADRAA